MNDNRALIRALRGPLTLIVVGMLFAIDHAGSYRFSQTWPVLIILFGLLTLLERAGGETTGGAQ
jgi:hypothetical protein